MSPTQRALKYCRDRGWTAQVVEHWNSFAGIRQDLFGCIDLIVLDGLPGGVLGVQVTASGVSDRLAKIAAEPRMAQWLAAPARLEVWGFRKLKALKKDGKKGKRETWEIRRVVVGQESPDAHHAE